MKYKVRLSKSIKNNYISLPKNSPLRQGLSSRQFSLETALLVPIKIHNLSTDKKCYLGFASGDS